MTKIVDPYVQRLHARINTICPDISNSVFRLGSLEPAAALRVLEELVASACQATNDPTIVAARKMIVSIQPEWFAANISKVIQARLNLDDDWEFRRLLELLKEVRPPMMAQFVNAGLSSPNADVREAAQDYATGRHGPMEGLDDGSTR